jgi:hypothetical protein
MVNTLHIWSVYVRFCSIFDRKRRTWSIDADGSLESGESEALSPERSDKAGLQGVQPLVNKAASISPLIY